MLLPVLLTLGCSDYEVKQQVPELDVSVDALDFEQVVRGTRVTLTFFARNEGRGVLNLEGLELSEASDPAFSVLPLPVGALDPGEEAELQVSYAPDEVGLNAGELSLISDDPERPSLRLVLSGEGVDPRIDVDPEALWFGDVDGGDARELSVDVTARGQGWLNIQDITLEGESAPYVVTLPDNVELPHRMTPGTGFSLTVRYAPDAQEPHEAELLIQSNDPENPVQAVRLLGNVDGSGLEPPSVEITSPDWGNYLIYGETAALRGVVVDDADPPPNLLCAWYSGSTLLGTSTADSSGLVALDTTALEVGEHTLTLRAVDSAGNPASDDVDVVVWSPEEPIRYVISGGDTVFDWFTVDDDLSILVDDVVVFQDTTQSQDSHQPVEFEAERGATIRLIANDINACQKSITPLTLHFGTSASQPLNAAVCTSSCEQDACYDPSYQGPWPNVFLDESYEILIP